MVTSKRRWRFLRPLRKISLYIVSVLLYYTGLLKLLLTVLSKLKTNGKAVILYYHRVIDFSEVPFSRSSFYFEEIGVPVEDFERQMRYLAKNHNVISLEEFARALKDDGRIPANSVVVTFDDGYEDNYVYAYPILHKYNIPATIFVIAGYVGSGRILWWDKLREVIDRANPNTFKNIDLPEEIYLQPIRRALFKLKLDTQEDKRSAYRRLTSLMRDFDPERCNLMVDDLARRIGCRMEDLSSKYSLLSWGQVKEMMKDGISIGSHTVTHPDLTVCPYEKLKEEIETSKKLIEEMIGQSVSLFAYPSGQFNNLTKQIARESGYKSACSTEDLFGLCDDDDMFELRRIGVDNLRFRSPFINRFSKSIFALKVFVWSLFGG